MGGNIAMHIGFRYLTEIGGIFSLSGFLKRHSMIFRVNRTSFITQNYFELYSTE